MSKRLLTFVCAAALLLAACNTVPAGTVNPGTGLRFVTQVADFADNVGLGNQVTVDKDGLPWLSYWGFPAKLKTGEIPVTRPIGSPYIPAVLVTTVSKSGTWIRGAAAQIPCPAVPPPCPPVPYGPATVRSLRNANTDNTNGTDVMIADDGSIHVVWTSLDGVYYGSGSSSGAFTETKLYSLDVDLVLAGPIGRSTVALDATGTPWVAYTINAATEQVRVASPDSAGKWVTKVIATLPQCRGCSEPEVTRIGMTPTGPVVAYVNPSTKSVMVATLTAGTWTTEKVASGATGGLSMAIDKGGAVYLTYYAGGTVQLASTKSGSWSTSKLADVGSSPTQAAAQPGVGNFSETTGVAVDDNGKIYATWYDGLKDAVQVVGGDGTKFTPIPATNTEGGRYPSIAVAHDGSLVYVAWYATSTQDQLLGVWGNQPSYAIGYPSPTTAPGSPPSTTVECGKDKRISLDEVAVGIAFKSTCLVAPATKTFSVNFDNQDATTIHNMAFSSDSTFTTILYTGAAVTGPNRTVYQVTQKSGPLKAGTYYFRCDYHPLQMQGKLVVVAGAK